MNYDNTEIYNRNIYTCNLYRRYFHYLIKLILLLLKETTFFQQWLRNNRV